MVFLTETKVHDLDTMNRIRLGLGFRNGEAVWSDGQSGRVVMFWEDGLDVRLLSKSSYHVDVEVFAIDELDVRWRLTGFYGHPSASEGTGGMILHFRSEFAVNVQNILMRRFRLLSFRCIRPSLLDRMVCLSIFSKSIGRQLVRIFVRQ